MVWYELTSVFFSDGNGIAAITDSRETDAGRPDSTEQSVWVKMTTRWFRYEEALRHEGEICGATRKSEKNPPEVV